MLITIARRELRILQCVYNIPLHKSCIYIYIYYFSTIKFSASVCCAAPSPPWLAGKTAAVRHHLFVGSRPLRAVCSRCSRFRFDEKKYIKTTYRRVRGGGNGNEEHTYPRRLVLLLVAGITFTCVLYIYI